MNSLVCVSFAYGVWTNVRSKHGFQHCILCLPLEPCWDGNCCASPGASLLPWRWVEAFAGGNDGPMWQAWARWGGYYCEGWIACASAFPSHPMLQPSTHTFLFVWEALPSELLDFFVKWQERHVFTGRQAGHRVMRAAWAGSCCRFCDGAGDLEATGSEAAASNLHLAWSCLPLPRLVSGAG